MELPQRKESKYLRTVMLTRNALHRKTQFQFLTWKYPSKRHALTTAGTVYNNAEQKNTGKSLDGLFLFSWNEIKYM